MKTTTLVMCVLMLAGAVATATAGQKKQASPATTSKKADAGKPAACQSKNAYQPQTGSRIQRTVDLTGRITDGPYQLVVISGEAMRRSGRATVAGVLTSQNLRR